MTSSATIRRFVVALAALGLAWALSAQEPPRDEVRTLLGKAKYAEALARAEFFFYC